MFEIQFQILSGNLSLTFFITSEKSSLIPSNAFLYPSIRHKILLPTQG
jgi:hypothetical protein